MGEINWPIIGVHHAALKDFVRFWEQLYSGYDEDFYQENVGQPLNEGRIAEWFAWKNGTTCCSKNRSRGSEPDTINAWVRVCKTLPWTRPALRTAPMTRNG